jgi:hypothetical protein
MAKVHPCCDVADGPTTGHMIFCPACECGHKFDSGRWTFNGDMERPTFSPSMLVRTGDGWTKIPQEQWMPIQSQSKGVSYRVPFAMLSEGRAQRNHDQSLAVLRSRGGLSAFEALCNLDDRGLWDRKPRTDGEEEAELSGRVQAWLKANCPPSICHSFVRDGRIEFLSDCTHRLAGQTVDLPDF